MKVSFFDVKKMSDDEKRMKIAQLCNTQEADFTRDLNAIASAEKAIVGKCTKKGRPLEDLYVSWLICTVGRSGAFFGAAVIWKATAIQKAEALLLTMLEAKE